MKHNTTILIAHWRSEDCYVPFLSDVRGKEQNRHTWAVWLIHFLLRCIMLGHSVTPAWVPCECCIGKKTAVASPMCPGHVDGNPADFSLWFFGADNSSYKQELKCVGSSVWNCGISKTIIGVISQCLREQEQPCCNVRPRSESQRRQIPHLFLPLFYGLPVR